MAAVRAISQAGEKFFPPRSLSLPLANHLGDVSECILSHYTDLLYLSWWSPSLNPGRQGPTPLPMHQWESSSPGGLGKPAGKKQPWAQCLSLARASISPSGLPQWFPEKRINIYWMNEWTIGYIKSEIISPMLLRLTKWSNSKWKFLNRERTQWKKGKFLSSLSSSLPSFSSFFLFSYGCIRSDISFRPFLPPAFEPPPPASIFSRRHLYLAGWQKSWEQNFSKQASRARNLLIVLQRSVGRSKGSGQDVPGCFPQPVKHPHRL